MPTGRSRSRKRQVFGRMQRARLYLEGNSHRVVRIGELAELTNFSSWYLSKTFQSLYEESPQSLSARLRLERAADLLRDTDMMVGEVAAASGFDNCCSFARAFRARYGQSASRWRWGNPNASIASRAATLVAANLGWHTWQYGGQSPFPGKGIRPPIHACSRATCAASSRSPSLLRRHSTSSALRAHSWSRRKATSRACRPPPKSSPRSFIPRRPCSSSALRLP